MSDSMDVRDWEDLGLDNLVEVFKWVGLETLLLSVPFVCKSWHKASLDPKCWQILIFPEIRCSEHCSRTMTMKLVHSYALSWHDFPSLSFSRFIVSRSRRSATELVLPGTCSWQVMEYVSEECPNLEFLGLSLEFLYQNGQAMENLIGKWKNLQVLSIGNCYMLNDIFAQIQLHCKKFIGLIFCHSWIGREEATAIASLPKIMYLSFRRAHIPQNNLHLILESCRSLELLELKQCSGFECDNQLRRMASHIKTVKYEESSSGLECDEYSYYLDEEQARLAYKNWLHINNHFSK